MTDRTPAAGTVLVLIAFALAGCVGSAGDDAISSTSEGTSGGPAAAFKVTPTQGEVKDAFRFDAGPSKGKGLSYAWDFADGTTGEGEKVDHVFAWNNHVYEVALTVTDSSGFAATATAPVTIGTGVNTPPTVQGVQGSDDWIETGTPVRLEVLGASDADGDPLRFVWSYQARAGGGHDDGHDHDHGGGDDGAQEAKYGPERGLEAEGAVIEQAFENEGRYRILARVRDPKGAAAEASYDVAVSAYIPKGTYDVTQQGTLNVSTAGRDVSAKLYPNFFPPQNTYVDSAVYPFILRYPGTLTVTLSWDAGPAGQNDLDMRLTDAVTGQQVAAAETRSAPLGKGPETFTLEAPAGEYQIVVSGYTGAQVSYELHIFAELHVGPDVKAYNRAANA